MTTLDAPLPDGYRPKQPFWTKEQRECFLKSLPEPRFCLWMERRTGKSKPIVDKACYYYERKSSPLHVNAVLVIAYPNGVHHGWLSEAFPENVPDRVPWRGVTWRANKCRTQESRARFKELCLFGGLAVFAVNVESTISDITQRAIVAFIKARRRVFVVYDESSALVNANAIRAKVAAMIGKMHEVILKSDLDGTPVDKNGPLDYYSQVGWMGHDILGYSNPVEFRHHYAEIKTKGRNVFWGKVKEIKEKKIKEGFSDKIAGEIAERLAKGESVEEGGVKRRLQRGRDWWTEIQKGADGLPTFRNMDELWGRLDPISYRATYRQCFPRSKGHVYSKRRFELSDEQRRVYDELQKEYRATLASGDEIEASHALTRMLRAQQVTSNYYPEQKKVSLHLSCLGNGCEACDDKGIIETVELLQVIDKERNPRLEALAEEIRGGAPALIWCRFRPDVDQCMELAASLGLNPCRYDGAVSDDGKVESKEGFQAGRYGAIIGNESSLSRGLKLFRAELAVGYSNMFSFRTREQIEGRPEHGSKETATQLVDLVANETVDDMSIIPALRAGMDVSTFVMRDSKREWI